MRGGKNWGNWGKFESCYKLKQGQLLLLLLLLLFISESDIKTVHDGSILVESLQILLFSGWMSWCVSSSPFSSSWAELKGQTVFGRNTSETIGLFGGQKEFSAASMSEVYRREKGALRFWSCWIIFSLSWSIVHRFAGLVESCWCG